MLRNTFCHIPGFGPKLESVLWAEGVLSWDAVCGAAKLPLPQARARKLKKQVAWSIEELSNNRVSNFFDLLPRDCRWRLFREFRHCVAYVDIETTGLSGPGDYITTVVIYDGKGIHYYIHGQNLDDLAHDVTKYALIVTYNGSSFDLPFIRSQLRVPISQPHIDLRQLLASLGYTGGQKVCEKQFYMQRGGLSGINGLLAMGLWLDYLRGNENALSTLVAYNALDAVNLEHLMVRAYNLKLQNTPFAESNRLAEPELVPEFPFEPHQPTIANLMRRYSCC